MRAYVHAYIYALGNSIIVDKFSQMDEAVAMNAFLILIEEHHFVVHFAALDVPVELL